MLIYIGILSSLSRQRTRDQGNQNIAQRRECFSCKIDSTFDSESQNSMQIERDVTLDLHTRPQNIFQKTTSEYDENSTISLYEQSGTSKLETYTHREHHIGSSSMHSEGRYSGSYDTRTRNHMTTAKLSTNTDTSACKGGIRHQNREVSFFILCGALTNLTRPFFGKCIYLKPRNPPYVVSSLSQPDPVLTYHWVSVPKKLHPLLYVEPTKPGHLPTGWCGSPTTCIRGHRRMMTQASRGNHIEPFHSSS